MQQQQQHNSFAEKNPAISPYPHETAAAAAM